MKTIKHPDNPKITKSVPDSALSAWVKAGWLSDDMPPVSPTAATLAPPLVTPGSCSTCGATGDQPCTSKAGNETKRHAKRA